MRINGNVIIKEEQLPLKVIETGHIHPHLDSKKLTNQEKIEHIAFHFKEIMKTLDLDLENDSLKDTPKRVAKMYVNEVFSGLEKGNKPAITLFDNDYNYDQMLVEKNIKVHSTCEHHFVPIIGKATVAYISAGKVIGLSKLNRIVKYYAKRPQVQERLTTQIADELKEVLQTEDVAVIIKADHMCVAMRGVEDDHSSTVTASYHGAFKDKNVKNELFQYMNTHDN